MNRVEGKLSAWHRLYLQLQDARQRLKQLQATPADSTRARLEAEVSRLQQESDSELEAFNSEFIEAKGSTGAGHSSNSRPGPDNSTAYAAAQDSGTP